MQQLTNMIVSKVYEAKSGESQYGPWTLYNIYLKDEQGNLGKKKFSYMQSGKKPIPKEGMKINYMEYETVQNGEYTNYNIKEIRFDFSKPQESSPSVPKKTGNVYIDDGKVILKLMEIAEYNTNKLYELLDVFSEGVAYFLELRSALKGEKPNSPENPDSWEEPLPEEPPDDLPEEDIPF